MNHNRTHLQPLPEPMDHLLTTHLFSTSSDPSSSVAFQTPPSPPPAPAKRKRSLPGHPDPESEVVALSPNSLLATNRFMCEICNKGFQRDQNLQLHRRGHNLPWKLKQRAKDEMVKKKVYVCPELGCVHHDPARALGDLTGIKKHFYRKHGEKKWKCEKCSKKYAVHSDWKAHSKTCGTKEYKCDCGALFSRRDSFITHKAFCDALVDDAARAITSNPFLPPPPPPAQQQATAHDCHHQSQAATSAPTPDIPNLLPTWLQPPGLLFSPPQNPSHVDIGGPSSPYLPAQPHMSATALLQKAAQLGAIMSTNNNTIPFPPFFTAAGAGAVSSGSGGSDAGSLLLHEIMMMKSMPNSFDGSDHIINAFGTNGGISDGLTRDFLGLSPLISHADHIVNLTVTGLTDHHANAAAAASSSQEIV